MKGCPDRVLKETERIIIIRKVIIMGKGIYLILGNNLIFLLIWYNKISWIMFI